MPTEPASHQVTPDVGEQIKGDAVYDQIRVTVARGKTARLVNVKLVGKPPRA